MVEKYVATSISNSVFYLFTLENNPAHLHVDR